MNGAGLNSGIAYKVGEEQKITFWACVCVARGVLETTEIKKPGLALYNV